MYSKRQYWIRVVIAVFLSVFINHIADAFLHVQMGSGRDWLIFLSTYGVLYYFFVFKWAKKQINEWLKEHGKDYEED